MGFMTKSQKDCIINKLKANKMNYGLCKDISKCDRCGGLFPLKKPCIKRLEELIIFSADLYSKKYKDSHNKLKLDELKNVILRLTFNDLKNDKSRNNNFDNEDKERLQEAIKKLNFTNEQQSKVLLNNQNSDDKKETSREKVVNIIIKAGYEEELCSYFYNNVHIDEDELKLYDELDIFDRCNDEFKAGFRIEKEKKIYSIDIFKIKLEEIIGNDTTIIKIKSKNKDNVLNFEYILKEKFDMSMLQGISNDKDDNFYTSIQLKIKDSCEIVKDEVIDLKNKLMLLEEEIENYKNPKMQNKEIKELKKEIIELKRKNRELSDDLINCKAKYNNLREKLINKLTTKKLDVKILLDKCKDDRINKTQLSKEFGINRATLGNCIKELEEFGLLNVEK